MRLTTCSTIIQLIRFYIASISKRLSQKETKLTNYVLSFTLTGDECRSKATRPSLPSPPSLSRRRSASQPKRYQRSISAKKTTCRRTMLSPAALYRPYAHPRYSALLQRPFLLTITFSPRYKCISKAWETKKNTTYLIIHVVCSVNCICRLGKWCRSGSKSDRRSKFGNSMSSHERGNFGVRLLYAEISVLTASASSVQKFRHTIIVR